MFNRIPGTKDTLLPEVSAWLGIEAISRQLFSFYNYSEIRPPLIEELGLFNRSLGEFAEVVQKQMFVIRHGEESYALRPEGTASVVRAYIENNLDKTIGFAKFYYIGPMFRLERPQKGRFRQFHHIGAEVIGSADPRIDSEIICLCDRLLQAFQIQGYRIKINTLGCAQDKKALVVFLQNALAEWRNELCQECRQRYDQNILRILDCKNEQCGHVIKKIGLKDQHVCADCKDHFKSVTGTLDALKIKYEISPYLVRGLDYYTRTVFEITHSALGSQDAIGAGGRYDNLVEELGGPPMPAIGFAFGIERLLLASPLSATLAAKRSNPVFVIALGAQAMTQSMVVLARLRDAHVCAETEFEAKSLKAAMRKANDLGAQQVVIIGDDELKKNAVMLKNMGSGEQKEVLQDDLVKVLQDILSHHQ